MERCFFSIIFYTFQSRKLGYKLVALPVQSSGGTEETKRTSCKLGNRVLKV